MSEQVYPEQDPYRPSTQQGQPVYRPSQTTARQQAARAGGYAQPTTSYAQPTAGYTQPAQRASAPAAVKSAGQGSFLKTFVAGFAGAALAALLVLGLTGNLFHTQTTSNGAEPAAATATVTEEGGTQVIVPSEDASLAEVVSAKTLPSVVCIYVYSEQTSYSWFGPTATGEALSSLGSGVILSEDGYVLTNNHVIEGESRLMVSANDTQYEATVVGTDPTSDLAVIKIEGAEGLVPMEIGTSADLKVGQWVMTVGSPYGMEQSVAAGIISAVSRSSSSLQSADDTALYANLIQTDAAINPGNSGGALVDAQGRLIGINTLTASYSGSNSGVGFAIPVDYAYSIATQIINGEEPSHAQLGVSLINVDAATAQRYNLSVEEGAYVALAYAGAAESGIQEGDIITRIDGKNMVSATEVILAIRSHMPGDTVSVEVNRNGETLQMDVVLTADNENNSAQQGEQE